MSGFKLRRQYPPGTSRFTPGSGQARFSSVGGVPTPPVTGGPAQNAGGGGSVGGAAVGGGSTLMPPMGFVNPAEIIGNKDGSVVQTRPPFVPPPIAGTTAPVQPGIQSVVNPRADVDPSGQTRMFMSNWAVGKGSAPQTMWDPKSQTISNAGSGVAPGQKVKFVWTDPVTGKRQNIY